VVASFPDQNRLIVFGPDGTQQAELPLPGNGSPVGVAIAPDGHILVADAHGNVVDELPMP
jgi:glucose/arabinose dehydrogenase